MDDLKLSTVQILFYKGRGRIFEKIIRKWTKSPYAHSEFARTDGYMHSNDRFKLISRIKPTTNSTHDWDSISIILPTLIVDRVQKRQITKKIGIKYDWLGIAFSQVAPLNLHNKNKWFCSKTNADDIYYAYILMKKIKYCQELLSSLEPILEYKINEYSPAKLYTIALKIRDNQQGINYLFSL